MDKLRAVDADDDVGRHYPADDEPRMDPPPAIGSDERRMHVRAYNHWVSLLNGRPLPSIRALDPRTAQDGSHGVLLNFTHDPENPAIDFLGQALREEGELGDDIRTISDVPGRSLVSRLTDHYLQIIANRSPVGFEAEFINERGNETLYRGILMPFTSDGQTIDYIYGVINWKERAAPSVVAGLQAEIARALPSMPLLAGSGATSWTDAADQDPLDLLAADPSLALSPLAPADPLEDQLGLALQAADAVATCEVRLRAALYRALSTAYDLALAAERSPAELRALLRRAGIRARPGATMTAVAKLVFGADAERTWISDCACVLSYGHRMGIAAGGLRNFLENEPGGLKAIVAAEREHHRETA